MMHGPKEFGRWIGTRVLLAVQRLNPIVVGSLLLEEQSVVINFHLLVRKILSEKLEDLLLTQIRMDLEFMNSIE